MTPALLLVPKKYLGRVGEHLLRMLPGIHLRIRRLHFTLLVNQIADAIGIAGFRIRAGAVREAELAIGVA
jgi:hypothetical protein